jgi:hypothetical protein
MNTQEFVNAVRTAVYDAAAKGTVAVLKRPPGRRPDAEMLRLSDWYKRLNSEDRENLSRLVDMAASQTTYNFLLILDGLLAVEPAGTKGKLELFYDDGKTRTRLNDENANQLSFLFKQTD